MNRDKYEINYDFSTFHDLALIAKEIVQGFIAGLHKSPLQGFSVNFSDRRMYNQGESTKGIDWKLFARTERLFIKQYEQETNLRCQLIIDTSSSMFFPHQKKQTATQPHNKLSYAIYCAAALIHLMHKQRDAVGLSLFDSTLHTHSPAMLSHSHTEQLFSTLHTWHQQCINAPLNQSTQAGEALHKIADQLPKNSLIILLSDLIDSKFETSFLPALQRLRYQGHQVVVFNLLSVTEEIEFNFKQKHYKFIDLETGTSVTCDPKLLQAQYAQQAQVALRLKTEQCLAHNIDFYAINIAEPFDAVLRHYLLKRF